MKERSSERKPKKSSVSLVGVGFIFGIDNGKLKIKLDPPGWFGLEISIDFGKIIQDLFGG